MPPDEESVSSTLDSSDSLSIFSLGFSRKPSIDRVGVGGSGTGLTLAP